MYDKIILEYRAIESEEENEGKNVVSSDDESTLYARRDSQESNASTASKLSTDSSDNADKLSNSQQSKDVDELTDRFDTAVKVAENESEKENTDGQVESLTEKLKTELSLANEEDLQDRQPERIPSHSSNSRGATHPYQQTRSVNHCSGGSVSQNDHLNINFDQLQPSRAASASPPQLIVLDGSDVSNFFNSMSRPEPEQGPSHLFNNMPPGPESSNFAIPVSSDSFSLRQSSPPQSFSSGSTPSYLSSDVFSPQSNFSSDASQPIGSPHHSLYDMPSTSGVSLASSSPARLLPRTLPNTSDEEEEVNLEGTTQLGNLIDNEMKEIKKYEWIAANVKELEVLFSELRKLLCKNTRLNDRKLVKIYAVISSILKQNGPLRQFFMEEINILSYVALKNHSLLLKYIIETMQNLGLSPEAIGETPASVLRKVIEQNQDMREVLKTLLSLRTKTGAMMFDINAVDQDGLTAIHRVLLKIQQMEDPEMKNLAISYLRICLEHRPDFTLTTRGGRTYLHHAIVLGCGALVVEKILCYCGAQNPTFDLVNETDDSGDSALRLAARLTQGRKEVEDVLFRYNAIYEEVENILDLLNI